MLAVYLRRVDRDGEVLPHRFYPLRPASSEDRKPVVIDPQVSSSRPTVAGSGISTAALVDRLDAGESVEVLPHDYRLDVSQVPGCRILRAGRLRTVYFIDRDLGYRIFPDAPEEAGLRVVRHDDHFPDHSTPDTVCVREVAEHGWVAVSGSRRQR